MIELTHKQVAEGLTVDQRKQLFKRARKLGVPRLVGRTTKRPRSDRKLLKAVRRAELDAMYARAEQ